jgi:hypothetical protein
LSPETTASSRSAGRSRDVGVEVVVVMTATVAASVVPVDYLRGKRRRLRPSLASRS